MPASDAATSSFMQAPITLRGGLCPLGRCHFVARCWTCGVLGLNVLEHDEILMTIEGTRILAAAYEQNSLANITSRQQLDALASHNV